MSVPPPSARNATIDLLRGLAFGVLLGCLQLPFFDDREGGHALLNGYFVIAVGSMLAFWHNALMQTAGYFNYCLNVYWSLSVEMVFCLEFPLLYVLQRRNALLSALVAAGVARFVGMPANRWLREGFAARPLAVVRALASER